MDVDMGMDFIKSGECVLGVAGIVLLMVLLMVFVVAPCVSRVVGKAVKTVLQTIDKRVLGVNVSFGHVRVNPCCLKMSIDGLTVENPEGYSTPYLVKMEAVRLDIGLRQLLCSCGKRLSVQRMELSGVEVNVEKTLTTSNVQDVLSHLGSKAMPDPKERESMSDSDDLEHAPAQKPKPKEKKKVKVDVHAVVVRNVSVNLQAWLFEMKLRPADLDFQDLTEDVRGHETQVVAQILLESLLMSVLSNLPAGDYMQQALGRRPHPTSCASSSSDGGSASTESGTDSSDEEQQRRCCR